MQVYEWQVHVSPYGYSSKMIHFPVNFIIPSLLQNKIRIWPSDGIAPSNYCDPYEENTSFNHVLSTNAFITNREATSFIDVNRDMPFPSYGTWEWIGGWKLDLESDIASDNNGWAYSTDKMSMLANKCHDFPTTTAAITKSNNGHINNNATTTKTMRYKFRRRRWIKQCVLVSYPSIGGTAKNFLRIKAKNASLRLSFDKSIRQLIDAKERLNDYEQKLAVCKDLNLINDSIPQQLLQLQQEPMGDEESKVSSNAYNNPLTNADSDKSVREERAREEDNQFLQVYFDNHTYETHNSSFNQLSLSSTSMFQGVSNNNEIETSNNSCTLTLKEKHANSVNNNPLWKTQNNESIINLE